MTSDRVQVVTSILGAVFGIVGAATSGVALYFSYQANQLADRNFALQGDDLNLTGGFISLWHPGADSWQEYGPDHDTDPIVHIPAEQWNTATDRSITVRIKNDGQSDAHLKGINLPLRDDGDDQINDASLLKPICADDAGSAKNRQEPCPDVIGAHDGYSLIVTIPDQYVQQVDPQYRLRGITICAYTADRPNSCRTIPVTWD
jgi:hypothetical protein